MSDRRSWRFTDGMLLVALVGLAIAATRSTWIDIFHLAQRNAEQSHVFLAPFVAGWLFWIRRERLRWIRPRWSLGGTVVVAVGWAMGVFGFSNGFLILEQFGQLLVVIGAALTILGFNFVWRFLPVFGALLFLLPVPGRIRQEIAIPLQEVTAVITHFGMELFGAPVIRTGNVLVINGNEVAVAEACNGMRMVAALAIVTYAFVFSVPMRQGVRFFLLGMSPLVAIACNVLRLTPTVLLYGYADVNIAVLFHDISGWLMLFVALGLLWALLGLLRWLEIPIAPYAVAEE
jgi:exosortase